MDGYAPVTMHLSIYVRPPKNLTGSILTAPEAVNNQWFGLNFV